MKGDYYRYLAEVATGDARNSKYPTPNPANQTNTPYLYMITNYIWYKPILQPQQPLSMTRKPLTRMHLTLARVKCSQHIPSVWVWPLTSLFSTMRFWTRQTKLANWLNRLIPKKNHHKPEINRNVYMAKRRKQRGDNSYFIVLLLKSVVF